MRTVVIFHDAYAGPTDDWIPWTKTQLEAAGLRVLTPGLPKPPAVTLSSWITEWSSFGFVPDTDTIFVGHGLGALFAIRLVEKLDTPIEGLVLVAPFASKPAHAALATASASFLEAPVDWEAVKRNAQSIAIFAGSDDPLVPLSQSEDVARNTGSHVQAIEAGGHLTRGSGYGIFVQLADAILQIAFPKKESVSAIPGIVTPSPEPTPIIPPAIPIAETQPEPKPLAGIQTMEMQSSAALAKADPALIQTALSSARSAEESEKENRAMNPKNLLRIVGGLALLCLAFIALVFGISRLIPQGLPALQDAELVPNAFLRAERVESLDVSTITSEQLRSTLSNAQGTTPRDSARLLVLSDAGKPAALADTVARISGAKLPISVQGFMDGATAIAILHPGTTGATFVILTRLRSYDGAFEALRAWESTLPSDISWVVPYPGIDINAKGLSSWNDVLFRNIAIRTTTGPAPVPEGIGASLNEPGQPDLIQAITDAVANASGPTAEEPATPAGTIPAMEDPAIIETPKVRMVYFFLDPETLAITSTTDVIPELVRRYWARPK